MGLYLYSTECAECGKAIKNGERVIVKQIEGGNYREDSSDIELDEYPIEQEVYHKDCWWEQTDLQLPEKPCTDGSIAV